MLPWLVLGIVVLTLILMLVRPARLPEGAYAAVGAALILATGQVGVEDLRATLDDTGDVLLFLVGMLLLVGVVERAKVFDVVGEFIARLANGRGTTLFLGISILAVLVTGLLSLDVTVILLPPVIFALSRQMRVPLMPLLMVTVFLANTASLGLPVSNLTNLLLFEQAGMSFAEFWSVMWLPNLLAAAITITVIWGRHRREIGHRFSPPPRENSTGMSTWTAFTGLTLLVSLGLLVLAGLAGRPLWWVAVAAGVGLVAIELARGTVSGRTVLRSSSPWVLLFVVGMSVVVTGFERAWIDGRTITFPNGEVDALLASVGLNAIGSNIVNNVPMTLLSGVVIEQAPGALHEVMTVGTLIGANIGPALTTYGSLATILWLAGLRREGIDLATRDYLRVSMFLVPAALAAAILGAIMSLGLA